METGNQVFLKHLYENFHFAPIEDEQRYQNHLIQCLNGLIYAKYILKQRPIDKLKLVKLPDLTENNKKTLFLDLDETLISSTLNLRDPNGNILQFPSGEKFSVRIRPYTFYTLEKLSKYYDIYIFSAGKEAYVNQVVQLLDPENKYICGVLSQNHCLKTKMSHNIKDLRIISNRSLSEMLIVDNSVCSFAYQISNGVPIISWNGELDDKELFGLTNYLIKLASYSDVSTVNAQLTNFPQF